MSDWIGSGKFNDCGGRVGWGGGGQPPHTDSHHLAMHAVRKVGTPPPSGECRNYIGHLAAPWHHVTRGEHLIGCCLSDWRYRPNTRPTLPESHGSRLDWRHSAQRVHTHRTQLGRVQDFWKGGGGSILFLGLQAKKTNESLKWCFAAECGAVGLNDVSIPGPYPGGSRGSDDPPPDPRPPHTHTHLTTACHLHFVFTSTNLDFYILEGKNWHHIQSNL